MKKKYYVKCSVFDRETTIRLAVPEEVRFATTKQIETSVGVRLCAVHRGTKWGVVKTYSIWQNKDGECYGSAYTAYDLSNPYSAEIFRQIECCL